jgi:hypothetical protein
MYISITYIHANITQVLRVVDQELFNDYQRVKLLVPSEKEQEQNKEIPGWNNLSLEERKKLVKLENELNWIGDLNKQGKMCTTGSPIYKAFMANDGLLRLPKSQGGNHPVKVWEENI